VATAEEDSDAEFNTAVGAVLEKGRRRPADRGSLATQGRKVTLEGRVFLESEKKKAEGDAWYEDRVRTVIARVEVERY
jgi:osmotically-inducible protein OsmY